MRIDHEKNIGKVINSLKIESSKKQGKYYFYHCICECGNEKDIRADHILSGYIKSCGCKRKNEKYKNLENIKFNKLLVKSIYKKKDGRILWECLCDCGNTVIVESNNLISGHTQSCGCYQKEQLKKALIKHGMSNSRLYRIWSGMKRRCYDKNNPRFHRYGGRGIKVCDEWKNNFNNFEKWALENGYQDNLTIDRIDNNGIYCPSNCRWVDYKLQAQNRSTNLNILYKNKKICITELSRILNIPKTTLTRKLEKVGK